jgi:hypothetical protein
MAARRNKAQSPEHPLVPVISSYDSKIQALEIDLSKLTTQVVQFSTVLEESGQAMDEKLDILLDEFKNLRETYVAGQLDVVQRLTRAETNIDTLLRNTRRGAR